MFNKETKISKLLILSISITNISQMPSLIGNRIIKSLVFLLWIILFIYLILKTYTKLNFTEYKLIYYFYIFFVGILSLQLILQKSYLNSSFIYPIILSIFIYFIGSLSGKLLKIKELQGLVDCYIYSSIIVGVNIYYENFNGVNWSGTQEYLYKSKNSSGTILVVAIILILFMWKKKNKWLRRGAIFFCSGLIFIMKSRANILILLIGVCFYFYYSNENIIKKLWKFCIGTIVLCSVLLNNYLYELIINNIILNGNVDVSINAISSGRSEHLVKFVGIFKENFLWGTGGTYLESFPLAVLASYGIFIGMIILFITIYPIIKLRKNNNEFCKIIVIINILFLINGIFEELAPFGPGVKCYFLWLMFGITESLMRRKKFND